LDAVGQPKPYLVVVPSSLLMQWIEELQKFTRTFRLYLYHGDYRAKGAGGPKLKRIAQKLTKGHAIFKPREENANIIVLTSYQTFSVRHGPAALFTWRRKSGMSASGAKALADIPDPKWELSLDGCFRMVVLDEAHLAKNEEAHINVATGWLEASFYVLATATPLHNSIFDFSGFLKLIQQPENARLITTGSFELRYRRGSDPFKLEPHHAAAKLALTTTAFKEFVLPKDKVAQGLALERIWSKCLIRRNYESACPAGSENRIGRTLPACNMIVLDLNFTDEAQKLYDTYSEAPLKKLVMKDRTGRDDSRLIINANSYRALVLLSMWPLFAFVPAAMNKRADTIKWPTGGSLLRKLLLAVHAHPAGRLHIPAVPEPDDVQGLLAEFLKFAPRLRALVANIADQVIKRKEKAVIWVLYPIEQLLVTAILRCMGVDAYAFLSTLNPTERSNLQHEFNNNPDWCTALGSSYRCSGIGMNLQKIGRFVHLLDPAPTEAAQNQAVGRSYRVGSTRDVLVIEYFVSGTFNEKQVNNQILKAIPGLMALVDRTKVAESFAQGGASEGEPAEGTIDAKQLEGFYEVNGQLLHRSAPEFPPALLESAQPLQPEEVLIKFFQLRRGRRVVQHRGLGAAFHERAPPRERTPEEQVGSDGGAEPPSKRRRKTAKDRKGKGRATDEDPGEVIMLDDDNSDSHAV
jgi:SNF2 family DNA or RNA helicase